MDRIIDVFQPSSRTSRVRLSAVMEGLYRSELMRAATGKGRVAAFEIMLGTPAIHQPHSRGRPTNC